MSDKKKKALNQTMNVDFMVYDCAWNYSGMDLGFVKMKETREEREREKKVHRK